MISPHEIIPKPEWVYKSRLDDYEFRISLIGEDILYGKVIGYAHSDDIKNGESLIQKAIDKHFPLNAPYYFILDLEDTTGTTTKARNEHLNYRIKQLENIALFLYSNPNSLLKIAIKTATLFSSQIRDKIRVSKNFNNALAIIDQHKKESVKPRHSNKSAPLEKKPINLPESKEELKELVLKLQKEKFEQEELTKKKTNQLIKVMGQLSWGNLKKAEPIKIVKEDAFANLFSTFNLLQIDLVELMTKERNAQKKLLEKEKQNKILFNNIADIVLLHDIKTQCFVDCNDRALKYGYTKEELLTMTPLDLHPPEEIKRVKSNINDLSETPNLGNRYKHIMKDGTQVDVEIRSSKIEYNGRPTWVSIIRDITARKKFEKAIIRKQEEAEAASQAKSEFLANMSHEIRTPMNGVIGMLDLLLETDLSEGQHEFATSAQQSADSLLVLINDILDFSKIEARKLEIEIIDFDLSVTLDSLSDLLSVKAFQKGIKFACLVENEVPLLLKGDPSRLRQILSNLAGNALKFTTQGEIFIKVSLMEETKKNATILFEVIDTGTGIEKDKIDTLFESFTQADTSITRNYGGTGLGLTIASQLAELMNGKICVKSEVGKGSNFYFTIDFEKQKNAKQKIILTDEIKDTKILIVDDNYTNHQIFKEYINLLNCPSDGANNGTDAIAMLKKAAKENHPYKLALIDMEMPNMTGIELGKAIKKDKDIKNTILIMLSSSASRGDVKKINKIGFAGFLTKPIKKKRLFDTIRTVLSIDSQNLYQASEPIITSYKVEEIKKTQIKNNSGLNILLVEDNKVNQFVIKKMVQGMAKKITIANNGKEGVDFFSSNTYDLIFMDIQMPVMDGTEAIKKIRKHEKKSDRHTPIIAITANAMKGDRERFLACGADEYLAKPLKKESLISTIESIGLI
ncbi:MAG: response regulator [Desulfobacteraceae bacterium]|nr:response regulator [Desulfobacteraceae bacterium]